MLLAERLRSEEEKAAMRVVLEEQVNTTLCFFVEPLYMFVLRKIESIVLISAVTTAADRAFSDHQ